MGVFFDAKQAAFSQWADMRLQLFGAYRIEGRALQSYPLYFGQPQAAWLLKRGRVTLHIGRERRTFRSGTWIFPLDGNGRQVFSPDAELLSIRYVAEWPHGIGLFDRTRTRSIAAKELGELNAATDALVAYVADEYPNAGMRLHEIVLDVRKHFALQALFHSWLHAYCEHYLACGLTLTDLHSIDARVRCGIDWIEKQGHRFALRDSDIAQEVGLSLSQFNKLFARELGKTPKQYREAQRVRLVRQALLNDSRTLKSIALDYGFNSLPHFSAWTKQRFGMPPRTLRKRALELGA